MKEPLGCFSFVSSGTYHLECRDCHIGWSKEQREEKLNWILNNNRFVIFPWVKIDSLASKVLSLSSTQIPTDWQNKFNYKPILFETYVDPSEFHGSIYKSANWVYIGQTSGNYIKNKTDNKMAQTNSPKDVYICPVDENYKDILRKKKPNIKSKKL